MLGTLLVAAACSLAMADWTPGRLLEAMKHPETLTTQSTQDEIVRWFGGAEKLDKGGDPKVDGQIAAFAVLVPEGTRQVTVREKAGFPHEWAITGHEPSGHHDPGPVAIELKRIGSGRLFLGAVALPDATSIVCEYLADGQVVGETRRIEAYVVPKEAVPDPNGPQGKLEQQPRLTSQVFGGTWHDWWLYTPPRFDPAKESNLVVFQDGQWAHTYVPTFFDNLCTWGGLDQTVVVCVTPGTFPDGRSDRSREYDTLSPAYSRFLIEELLPIVEAKANVSQDPSKRCVAGLSSGGICSFTVAWERPDKFGLVMSWIGSFTNIASGTSLREGGHNYPALVRKTDKKPIRVFLQDGENDLDNVHGNWPLSNREMAKALAFKGYDLMTVWGRGGHTDLQGRANLPDALRWLFRKS